MYDVEVVPPLLKMLRLGFLRYRAMFRTLPHLADGQSKRAFLRAGRKYTTTKPTDASAPLIELKIKELGGERIWCRSGLSDLFVFNDTFTGGNHTPPQQNATPS
ncbi:MAG: hypothetical protein GY953_12695, partial [bacterium]|nr:hypothetical protein [bacterium]